MQSQKNITHVFVGKDAALATGARSAMSAGQIGIFRNGSMTAATGAIGATDRFKVVLKDVNGKFIESPLLLGANVKAVSVDYAAATEKKVAIGYNGTSGAIAVANSEVYVIHMNLQDDSRTWGEHPLFKMVAAYQSDASATQTEICAALVTNALKNFEREAAFGVDYMTIGKLNSLAAVTTNDFAGNCVVVNGSNAITVASSGQYATNTDVVAGDYIRLGATTGTAITVAANVYQVVSISGTTTKTYVLDRAVTEPSGTYSTGTGTEVIAKADAEGANWGITFTAKALPFQAGLKKYAKLNFQVQLGEGFGSTPNTVLTAASKGQGTYAQVAEEEWDGAGNRGETYRVADYPVAITLNADSTKTYDCINVDFVIKNATDLDHDVSSFGSLTIYTEPTQANDALKTAFGI